MFHNLASVPPTITQQQSTLAVMKRTMDTDSVHKKM